MKSKQVMILPDFFERYVVKGLIKRATGSASGPAHTRVAVARSAPKPVVAQRRIPRSVHIGTNKPRSPQQTPPPEHPRAEPPEGQPKRDVIRQSVIKNKKEIVGRALPDDATKILIDNLKTIKYPISNGIGVGILSYNRGDCLRRLVDSIRKHTDLRRTTLFISDDSSNDTATCQYLAELATSDDIVIIRNESRLGVAGNSNRLLRCLSRFRTGILLNDDVEVIQTGWEHAYASAMSFGAIKHFCMHQPGLYGARTADRMVIGDLQITKVNDRPHGAVMAFTTDVLQRIGYFDEKFGIYGMEHVDWSRRVSLAGLQPGGFYDIATSNTYLHIHNERSAVENREQHLANARTMFNNLDGDRSYIKPSGSSAVPSISVVIPCRDTERHGGINTVIAGIAAQRFPSIEIIVAEHDTALAVTCSTANFKHILAQSGGKPFNKSMAFNAGVAAATTPYLVLQDADLIMPGLYTKCAYDIMQTHDACHFGKSVLYLGQHSSMITNNNGVVGHDSICDRIVGYFEGGSIACRRGVYWRVGGFNEDFWGYGVEDCEFYERLKKNCNWKEDRRLDFVHIWHGRSANWEQEHQRNRELGRQLDHIQMAQRVYDRYAALRSSGYGEHLDSALKGLI